MIILKQMRFNEFMDSIEGISSKTLCIRLKEMEEDGLIKRIVVSSRPIHTEYAVTDKGMMVEPVLEALADISMKYEPKAIFKDGRPRDRNEVLGDNIRLSAVYDY